MTDPTTSNVLLSVPTRGSDVGTWDTPVNGNSVALDGYLGGVQTVSVSNAPVTLTAPTGTTTPTAGPYQSQNRVLKFTGALSANVQITFPLPGEYTIQNLTTGNFVLSFKSGGGNIVATPQGSVMKVWNDGTDCWLIKPATPGQLIFMGGISAVPSWITACTVRPFLLNDGSVYNISSYPALGALYGASFGGNGVTTFGVQDLQGRVPLAYDGTGTRITTAGCGINGQTMGAAGGSQNETLVTANLPPYTPSGSVSTSVSTNGTHPNNFAGTNTGGAFSPGYNFIADSVSASSTFSGTAQGGTSTPVPVVQPAQVAGIWLVAT